MLLSCHPGKLDVVVVCNEWIRTAKLATNTVVVGSFIILLCSTMMKGIAQYYTTKFLKNKIDKLPIIMVLVTNFAALSNEQLIRRRRNTCKVPLPLSRPSVWWTACCMHNCGWMVRWEEEEGNSCLDDGNQTVALSSGAFNWGIATTWQGEISIFHHQVATFHVPISPHHLAVTTRLNNPNRMENTSKFLNFESQYLEKRKISSFRSYH